MSDAKGPYRIERSANQVIPPDHRRRDRLILAACSAMMGAIVASVSTAFVLRTSAPPLPQPLIVTPSPQVMMPAAVAAPVIAPVAPVAPPCIIAPGMDTNSGRSVLPMIPRYPGATTRTAFDTGTGGASVILETCVSVDEVVAFYRQTKNLDSDGERETPRGRDFFFTQPAGSRILQYRVGVVRENGITKIYITESTPRMAPNVAPNSPNREPSMEELNRNKWGASAPSSGPSPSVGSSRPKSPMAPTIAF